MEREREGGRPRGMEKGREGGRGGLGSEKDDGNGSFSM